MACTQFCKDFSKNFAKMFVKGGSSLPPFYADAAYDWYKSDNDLLKWYDRVSNDVTTADIVGGYVVNLDSSSYFKIQNTNLATKNSVMLSLQVYVKSSTSNENIVVFGNGSDFISLYYNISTNKISVYDSLTGSLMAEIAASYNTWYSVELSINGASSYLKVDSTTATFTLSFTSDGWLYVGGNTSGAYRLEGYVSGIDIEDCLYLGCNNHTIDSITGDSATWGGAELYVLENTEPLTNAINALKYGYYQNAAGKNIVNPTVTLAGGTEYPTAKIHNLIPSFVIFPSANIFDRSNTTYFTNDARTSIYYDSSAPTKFYISNDSNNELEFDTMQTYYESAYKSTNFAGYNNDYCDKLAMFENIVYLTKKTGSDYVDVLNWAHYFCPSRNYIVDASGNYVLDSNERPTYS